MSHATDRLKEIYETTIESGLKYEGNHTAIEYFELSCKATKYDNMFSILGNTLCMFNYSFEGVDAVMMLFTMPINSTETGAKNIAERVMQVIAVVEDCFVTTNYVKSEEVKEDKFVYITVVKNVEESK